MEEEGLNPQHTQYSTQSSPSQLSQTQSPTKSTDQPSLSKNYRKRARRANKKNTSSPLQPLKPQPQVINIDSSSESDSDNEINNIPTLRTAIVVIREQKGLLKLAAKQISNLEKENNKLRAQLLANSTPDSATPPPTISTQTFSIPLNKGGLPPLHTNSTGKHPINVDSNPSTTLSQQSQVTVDAIRKNMYIAEEDLRKYEPLISSYHQTFEPQTHTPTPKSQAQLRYISDHVRKMSCPSTDTSPLEYTLFNIYKGNFTPPPNFTEMSTEECANAIKIMSDVRIKTIGAQINKYKRNYEKTHTHPPQLYSLCTRIVDRYRELKQIAYQNAKKLHNKRPNIQETPNTPQTLAMTLKS